MAYEFEQTKLIGADFRGKNLTGANFSNVDIRGANFSNAILVGANFRNCKAGLSAFWTIGFAALSFLLALFAGIISGYSGTFVGYLLSNDVFGHSLFGVISITASIGFLIIIVSQGFGTILATLAELIAACFVAALAFLPDDKTADILVNGVESTALTLAGVMAGIVNIALAVALAKIIALPGMRNLAIFLAVIGTALGILLGTEESASVQIIIVIFSLATVVIAFGIYVGLQAITGNEKYSLIKVLAISIVARGGTSFRGADLTNANFTQATLKSTDFRRAKLTRTCWSDVQSLNQARLEGTYLQETKIRRLVITQDGRDKKFDYLNLQGLNLQGANLQDASFIGTDLSEANLKNANLSGAKLAQTQLYQANLNGVCLTGAYIENWGISTDTQLEGIKCEYIYMQLPTREDPDPCRKPDNRKETFKEGDFADFIAPIVKTLDLYKTQNIDLRQIGHKFKTLDLFHYQGIDPAAAAVAISQVAEKHPEADLQVVALEGRGQEKIRLQARVAGDVNRSELNQEYFQKYIQIQSLTYSDLQELLIGAKEKDERIRSLERILENAIHQPKFYVETIQSQGEFTMSESKGNISIGTAQGNISGVAATGENSSMTGVMMGAISGNVTNTINQLPNSPEPEKPGIKELLQELQTAIEADTNLSDEDKAEALEQVQTIAEAGQKPEDGAMQKMVKTALKILKGTIAELPSADQLVEVCGKLFPAIAIFFGL